MPTWAQTSNPYYDVHKMVYRFPNFPSPHCHIQSLDTGCLPEHFAAREVELGTGTLTTTDHGSLGVVRTIQKLAKKNGLNFVPGLEGYVRDDNCPILLANGYERDAKGTLKEYAKYFHLTMHFLDQEAYELAVKLISRASLYNAEKHGSESKPIFTWAEVEQLGATNTIMTSSCLGGMVAYHLKEYSNEKVAREYFLRLKSICKPQNFYVELFPHTCDHYIESGIFAVYEGEQFEQFRPHKKIYTTEFPEGMRADYMADKHARRRSTPETAIYLTGVMDNRVKVDREPKILLRMEKREGEIYNECRPPLFTTADVQQGCNKWMLDIAEKHHVPVLISDDAHFATPDQKIVQDVRLSNGGSWKFVTPYYRITSDEAFEHFRRTLHTTPEEFEGWLHNNQEWAARFKGLTFKDRLSLPTSFYPAQTLPHAMDLIEKHGRMDWGNTQMVQRLSSEIEMLYRNGVQDFLPYFFTEEEVCWFYQNELQMLTGPGRGSAAGMLFAYLLNITHVDPIRYGLSQDRFMTPDRIANGKLPDIDQDLPDRDPLLDPEKGFLVRRFGKDHVAQISTDTTMKLRNAVHDVCRAKFKTVPFEVEELTKKFINAPQGVEDLDHVFGYDNNGDWVQGSIEKDDALKTFIQRYPAEWKDVELCLGVPRQKGRHPCAYLITNEPVSDFIPLMKVKDNVVTQYTAESCEQSGAVKFDFLRINSLEDLSRAIKLIQYRHGNPPKEGMTIDGRHVPAIRLVPFNDRFYDIWDLPEEQAVFKDICEGKTETVFQFDTPSAKGWLRNFNHKKLGSDHKLLDSIEQLAAFTALDRPGPLDYYLKDEKGRKQHNMLIEYAFRARGKEPLGNLPFLDQMFPDTHGVIVYQEQLTKVFREIGGTTGIEAENFRIHVGKKMVDKVIGDKAIFMPGATAKLGAEVAEELWKSLETFGQYGFNKSHAVCYVVISYACAFLKHFYELEWWTSVLHNASKNEIDQKFWPYCGHLIALPDFQLSDDNFTITGNKIRAPISLIKGIGPKAHEQLMSFKPCSSIQNLCVKIEQWKDTHTTTSETGKIQRGRSALNKRIVYSLIVAGVFDSFYDPNASTMEKLQAYEDALAIAQDKKKSKPVDQNYYNLSDFQKFQMKKGVLPAFTADLRNMYLRNEVAGVTKLPDNTYEYQGLLLVQADDLEFFEQESQFLDEFKCAVPVYVVVDERRTYAGGKKEMQKLLLDIEGVRKEYVRWPGKSGKLNLGHKTQAGVLGIAIMSRYRADRPFSVESIIVLADPLSIKEDDNE